MPAKRDKRSLYPYIKQIVLKNSLYISFTTKEY